jgi:lipopolysaccharide export system permease protein
VKIINRYILKEHIGPFVFALSALTSLLLLQYVARKFGDLVGRGLSWQVIGEFFLLSIPFTVAMTLPMSILVSVLYAFTRLAGENEVTALKAGGVSARSLMKPALGASFCLALFMLWFNDQLLPQANHELAALQMAIFRTKPTFALKPQVINTVKEGQLYLRAGYIAEDRTGRMRDVTIYDVSDATRRRTIYADSGTLGFAANRRDLTMKLYDGMMLSAPSNQPQQLNRIYYKQDHLMVRDIANQFQPVDADTAMKGEREMSICEMQKEYDRATARVHQAEFDSTKTAWHMAEEKAKQPNKQTPDQANKPAGKRVAVQPAKATAEPKPTPPPKGGGIGAMYCSLIQKYFKVREAHAAELPRLALANVRQDSTKVPRQDTAKARLDSLKAKQDSAKIRQDSAKVTATQNGVVPAVPPQRPNSAVVGTAPPNPNTAPVPVPAQASVPVPVPVQVVPPGAPGTPSAAVGQPATALPYAVEASDAKIRLDQARHERNRYGVEIQKKFSLAAACIVLVLVGAPLALRFPGGGVGLVFGVSFLVFAIYYIGLIGGEALSDKGIISPFWAMWADNIVFSVVGLLLMTRMGHEGVTSRGGGIGEWIEKIRARFARPAPARAEIATVSQTPT